MRNVARAKWIANFDIEDLVSSILRNGMLISMGFIIASLVFRWIGNEEASFGPNLQAKSIPTMILSDLPKLGLPNFRPSLLLHLGVAVLLLTPYVRVFASMVYFTLIERSRKYVLFTSFVLLILTIILLTELV